MHVAYAGCHGHSEQFFCLVDLHQAALDGSDSTGAYFQTGTAFGFELYAGLYFQTHGGFCFDSPLALMMTSLALLNAMPSEESTMLLPF